MLNANNGYPSHNGTRTQSEGHPPTNHKVHFLLAAVGKQRPSGENGKG